VRIDKLGSSCAVETQIRSGRRVGSGSVKAGDRHHCKTKLQEDHIPVPAIISGFAEGERGLVSEYIHSRLLCCKPVM